MNGSQASWFLRALLRFGPVLDFGPRHIPVKVIPFPCESFRPIIPGTARPVSGISGDELANAVGHALARPQEIHVIHAGMLVRASDVIFRGPEFFSDAIKVLVDHVTKGANTPDQLAAAMNRLLGPDRVKQGGDLSLGERSMRAGKALMAAVSEFSAHNLPAELLLDPRVIDKTVEFVRNYVVRGTWVHGELYELRHTAEMEVALGRWLTMRYQLQLPPMLGVGYLGRAVKGPDTGIFHALKVYLNELKASRDIAALFVGSTPTIRRVDVFEAGTPIKVTEAITAPPIHKQVYTSGVRSRHTGYRAPRPGAMELEADGSLPSDLTGWDDIWPTSVYSLADDHAKDAALATIEAAVWSTGRYRDSKVVIDLMNDVPEGEKVRARLVDMCGRRHVDVSGPDEIRALQAHMSTWLEKVVPHLEGDVNDFLGRSDVVDHIGRQNAVEIVLASKGVMEIPRVMKIPIPGQ